VPERGGADGIKITNNNIRADAIPAGDIRSAIGGDNKVCA
jgi:hypothetical protein